MHGITQFLSVPQIRKVRSVHNPLVAWMHPFPSFVAVSNEPPLEDRVVAINNDQERIQANAESRPACQTRVKPERLIGLHLQQPAGAIPQVGQRQDSGPPI